jgi:hypothetical protein
MATAGIATIKLRLDASGLIADLRGLADALEAIAPEMERDIPAPVVGAGERQGSEPLGHITDEMQAGGGSDD